MKLTSYWLDTAEPAGDFRRTPIPSEVDVAVVGGGFTGLSAALELAKLGASVALLEQQTVGWGASGRNGGMATTGLAIGFGQAVRRYGEQAATGMFLEYNRAIDTIESLVKEHGIDCAFERTGKLTLAYKPAHFDSMKRSQELLARLADHHVHLVPKADIRSEIGSDFYHGATVDPYAAGLHVARFAHGLAGAAVASGAGIHENAAVTELRRVHGSVHDVHTTRGITRAKQVLVGTSGYTGRPFPWLRRRVIPVGSFIVVTEPLPADVLQTLMPHRRMASDSKNLIYYFRVTPDNRMLFGGRARFALSNPDSDLKSGEVLRKAMAQVFPTIADARIDYTWGGLVDLSMDQMVHAGEHDGVFYSLCYSGHGVQMATHMGTAMASYLGGDRSANPWSALRFPPVPGHFGRPWFLPIVGGAARLADVVT